MTAENNAPDAAGRGMTVDGDVLRDVLQDATPRLLSDDFAQELADRVLDRAAAAGMTVLHGQEGRHRASAERVVAVCPECGQDVPATIAPGVSAGGGS